MQLPDTWHALSLVERISLSRQMRKSFHGSHDLHGTGFKIVAKSDQYDEVLLGLCEGTFAVVHMTWQNEASPDWPQYTLYETYQNFLDDVEHEAEAARSYVPTQCEECGSNWSANEIGSSCRTCGGYALFRPCPVCGGKCGAIWERAVIDSNDSQEPVFLGACKAL